MKKMLRAEYCLNVLLIVEDEMGRDRMTCLQNTFFVLVEVGVYAAN